MRINSIPISAIAILTLSLIFTSCLEKRDIGDIQDKKLNNYYLSKKDPYYNYKKQIINDYLNFLKKAREIRQGGY